MVTEKQIDAAVKALFEGIQFQGEPAGLYDPIRYMVRIGGKRLRPKLCLTAFALFRDSFGEQVLEPAAALEVFHTFTLIHDDIMDRSPLRRGQETVWKKWDPDTAILAGDAMCIDSYRRMAKAPAAVLPQVLELFSETAALVCDGQQKDMDFERVPRVGMEEYMQMIAWKTAVLLACSAKLGGLIAGADAAACDNLYGYGYDLGLAFQVADDYLDAYGDEKVFGKPIGGDILNAKKSWLTVRAMEKGAEGLEEALAAPADTPAEKAAKIARVKAIYDRAGVPAEALRTIAELHEQALAKGAKATDAEGFALLKSFADSLVGRTV